MQIRFSLRLLFLFVAYWCVVLFASSMLQQRWGFGLLVGGVLAVPLTLGSVVTQRKCLGGAVVGMGLAVVFSMISTLLLPSSDFRDFEPLRFGILSGLLGATLTGGRSLVKEGKHEVWGKIVVLVAIVELIIFVEIMFVPTVR